MSGDSPSNSPTSSPDAGPKRQPRRRGRVRRVIFWIGGIFLILILLLLVVVEIVLLSGLPRRIITSAAGKALGLRVEAKHLHIGWWGRSELTGLTVGLPLTDKPFLSVPTIEVRTDSLLKIALTQSVDIESVRIDKPVIDLVQSPGGQWNLQQVAELFGGGEPSQPAEQKKSGPPHLPNILVRQASLNITDNQGRHTEIHPLRVEGGGAGPLAYRLEVTSPGRLRLAGTLALNRTYRQQFVLQLHSVDAWVAPFIKSWPDPAAVDAIWDGRIVPGGGVRGKLTFQPLMAGNRSIAGAADVVFDKGALTVTPAAMTVRTALAAPLDQLRLQSGNLVVGQGQLKVDALSVAVAGAAQGAIQVNAQAQLSGGAANTQVSWKDLHLPGGVTTSGTLDGSFSTPWPGGPKIAAHLEAAGDSSQGPWELSLGVDGRGSAFKSMDWVVRSKGMTLHRNHGRTFRITDFLARLEADDGKLTLTDLNLRAPAQLSGRGAFDFTNHDWWLWVESQGWPVGEDDTLGFSLNAWGDSKLITLQQFYAHSGKMELVGSGYYGFDWPKPLDVTFYASHPPDRALGDSKNGPVKGRFHGYINADGTLSPLEVSVKGQLHGRNLRLADRPLHDIDAHLTGEIGKQLSQVHLKMRLIDGRWTIDGVYPGNRIKPVTTRLMAPPVSSYARVNVQVNDISLDRVGKILKLDGLSGKADGSWTLDLPSGGISKWRMNGSFQAAPLNVAHQEIQSLTAAMALDKGWFELKALDIKEAKGDGRIHASARLDLADPQIVESRFQLSDWGLGGLPDDMAVRIDAATEGGSTLNYHLRRQTADGAIHARAQVQMAGESAADAKVKVELRSVADLSTDESEGNSEASFVQSVQLPTIDARVLGGTIQGQLRAQVDQLAQAGDLWKWSDFNGRVSGRQLDLGRLPQWSGAEPFKQTHGTLDFQFTAQPAAGDHPLGPQAIELTLRGGDARYNGMQFTGADFKMFLGDQRLVFASDPAEESVIHVAGGDIYPWLRISKHPTAGYFGLLNGRFDAVGLDQVVHALNPDAKPMPGRLSGTYNFQTDLADMGLLNGQADVRIDQSDLVNFPPLAFLYNLMNVGGNPKTPTGAGELRVTIERSQLSIANAHYFNRGIDAIGSITLKDIRKGKESPIEGGVVGTARPLKDAKLPLLADADKLMSNLQSFLTAVGIDGTLGKPHIFQTALTNFGGELQKAILGDVKKAKQ